MVETGYGGSVYLDVVLVIDVEHIPLTGAASMVRYGFFDAHKHDVGKLFGWCISHLHKMSSAPWKR